MSFYNTKILTFISFIIFNTTLVSQIVDIETSRKEDLVGTKISLNLGFDGSSGTVDRTNSVSYTHLTLPTKRIV